MKFWIGLLTGVAAGVTVGMLYAPARGSVTRRRIVKSAGDFADTSSEMVQDFTHAAKRKARNVSKMATEKVQQASEFAKEKADDVSEVVGAITEKFQRVTA
jgi:gas vesicle protein